METAWNRLKDKQGTNPPALPELEALKAADFDASTLLTNALDIKVQQPVTAQVGTPVNIAFQLVHGSDNSVISSEGIPPGYKLDDVSVTAGSDKITPAKDDANNYSFPWAPKSENDNKFNVVASFVNEKSGDKCECQGALAIAFGPTATPTDTATPTATGSITPTATPTDTATPTATGSIILTSTSTSTPTPTGSITPTFTSTPTSTVTATSTGTPTITVTPVTETPVPVTPLALSLIIMPPRLPVCSGADQPIVLPMKLNTDRLKLDSGEGVINPEWYKTSAQGISDTPITAQRPCPACVAVG